MLGVYFMNIKAFYDNATATITYVVADEVNKKCAIIDPVLDYDQAAGKTSTNSADEVIEYIQNKEYEIEWILETHIHADHLTASDYIKDKLGGKSGIGDKITDVLQHWVPVFNSADDTPLDGSQFDMVFANGDKFKIGDIAVYVIHTPGHTPACISYYIEDEGVVFVGDTVFMPHLGTARADFPGGDTETLYNSIQKIFSLPDETIILTCHDYPKEGEEAKWETTVAEQKKNNIMINANISKEEYIEKRKARDKNLAVPKLLLPSIQFNLRVGKMPKAEDNGIQYIKIPINKL